MSKIRIAVGLLLGASLLLGPGLARAERAQHEDISITRNNQFDSAHGVRSGRGTHADPYVISGWTVSNITIGDTSKAVRIRDLTVWGTMTLNWVGNDVYVHRVDVGDLRVNENVPRTGAPTAGIIDYSHFGSVSQIRHFDGRFVHNTVGSPNNITIPFTQREAINFDGFNGGTLADNLVYGFVTARLHGHHHSSDYGMPSHMHSGPMDMPADHYHRYHEVFIERNHIVVPGGSYALIYTDENHQGNDRTAPSETDKALNLPHVHYTRVHIRDNVLDGAGIYIDIFNALDELHKRFAMGSMDIVGNTITLARAEFWPFQGLYGVQVWQARYVGLRIEHNTVTAPDAKQNVDWLRDSQIQGAGVILGTIDHSDVMIGRDTVTNLTYGVQATDMTSSVDWTVASLSTLGVTTPVYYDSSVKSRPHQR